MPAIRVRTDGPTRIRVRAPCGAEGHPNPAPQCHAPPEHPPLPSTLTIGFRVTLEVNLFARAFIRYANFRMRHRGRAHYSGRWRSTSRTPLSFGSFERFLLIFHYRASARVPRCEGGPKPRLNPKSTREDPTPPWDSSRALALAVCFGVGENESNPE